MYKKTRYVIFRNSVQTMKGRIDLLFYCSKSIIETVLKIGKCGFRHLRGGGKTNFRKQDKNIYLLIVFIPPNPHFISIQKMWANPLNMPQRLVDISDIPNHDIFANLRRKRTVQCQAKTQN